MRIPTIELKLLKPEIFSTLPKYGTTGAAAVDLHAAIDKVLILKPNACELVSTGIAIHIADPSLAGMILPRSGLGHKKGLVLGNSIGLIDSDYQGELMVSCWNRSNEDIIIEPLMRFAQLIIVPVVQVNFVAVNEFNSESERNIGGFGHTGVK
ncbi:dUTP diphosphatase [Fastidiosibacter lacustris]|uniref:dUTP diphosphatase n=1 Tax=Fastidiosibacter lacustris TaxID=2056695 RepID=UPI000E34B435|nr:dUTP diphosphatase [Fastidiosibacter lacustris]